MEPICHCGTCIHIRIGRSGRTMTGPPWLAQRGWVLHNKGYAKYGARGPHHPRTYAHRIVIHRLIVETRPWFATSHIPFEYHVHHMDYDKLNNCPLNLVVVSPLFNPSGAIRCPYTGRYLTKDEYIRRYT